MKMRLLIALLLGNGFLVAQAPSTPQSTLDQKLQTVIDSFNIVGFGVSVFTADSTLYTNGFGYSNVKDKAAYTTKTLQNIASISKTTIGISLLKAQEMGWLDLDDPINKHLPFEIGNPYHKKDPITIRHLANHTSSIKDLDKIYEVHGYHFGGDSPIALKDFIQNYLRVGGKWYSNANFLRQKPGKVYEYSNIAAGLAGLIIEHKSGMSYAAFTKKHILDPIGMKQSNWFIKDINTSLHSKLYESNGEKEIEWYGLATYPDGGLRTCVEELTIYLQTIMNKGIYKNGKLLEEASVEEMLRPFPKDKLPKKKKNGNQGIFWEFEEYSTYKETHLIGHTGGDPGVSTFMMYDPKAMIGYIAFFNTDLDEKSYRGFIKTLQIITNYGRSVGYKNN